MLFWSHKLVVSFNSGKLLNRYNPICQGLALFPELLESIQKAIAMSRCWSISPCASLLQFQSFMCYIEIFGPLWFIFVCVMIPESSFILLLSNAQCPRHHLLKMLYFFQWMLSITQHLCKEAYGYSCQCLLFLDIFLLLFYSVGHCICFHVSTMLFLLVWLYCIFWNQVLWLIPPGLHFYLRMGLVMCNLLCSHTSFSIVSSSSVKDIIRIVLRISLTVYAAFCDMVISKVFILPIYECEQSSLFPVSSMRSSLNALCFSF